jgi:putative DNA primase/helicase
LNPSDLFGHITVVANQNSYHPVRDWIDQQVWDGQDRLPLYYNSIELQYPNDMKDTIMRKWVLSCVAALYHDNFSCEGVLTLQSPQGRGKTISIENILPRQYHSKWNRDGAVIDMRDKDSQFKALSAWITELGEVDATFRKSDMEALKAFITGKIDMLRPPYERKANRYPRRTVFYATVNAPEFLQDWENRRFWVLAVDKFNHVTIDAGQFWAQIKSMYQSIAPLADTPADRIANNEYGWFMSPHEREQMQDLQSRHKVSEPIEELLQQNVILTAAPGLTPEWLNATAILAKCGLTRPNKRDLDVAGRWLKSQAIKHNSRREYDIIIRIADSSYVAGTKSLRFVP